LVQYDTIYFTGGNDGPDTFWRTSLGISTFYVPARRNFRWNGLGSRENLQDRNPYVWQKAVMERNWQMADVQIVI